MQVGTGYGGGEAVIYQDQLVTITTARAIMAGVMYAVANVTSVRQFEQPAEAGFAWLLGTLGILIALVCALSSSGFWAFMFFAGGVAFIVWATRQKAKHWVRIGTAGAETNAIWSHDRNYIGHVVTALNQAIISRG